ncbi:MAG: hypothetical protein JSW40_03500 [Candidatus Omnitrophota bacterium]|nr:MAG: hypothetical protein JSW40_03500 [Candidatus Omnitrophota bacterium]
MNIDEKIKRQIKGAKKWREANPGLSWVSQTYSTDEEKIYITKELLASKAYRSLSRVGLLVYHDFLSKRFMIKDRRNKQWQLSNNGDIIYPYSEAKENGFTPKQFRNAIDELQSKGLLDITHLGKGGKKSENGSGDVTTYWIDDRWQDYGTENFKPPRNPRKKDSRQDRGFALLMRDPKKAKNIIEKRKKTVREKASKKTNLKCLKGH